MVGANPYREPALVAKMATTLDHISNGRAILGIGAAWFEQEAHDFGFEFGDGPPERLRWLGEALPVMRGMLDGTEPSACRSPLPRRPRAQPAGPDPAAPAHLRRRRRREGDPQAGGPVRRHVQHRRRAGDRAQAATRSCASTARRSGATSARSSARPASARSSSATIARRRTGSSARPSSATRSTACGPTSRWARPRTSPTAWRRTWSWATATSSPACPAAYDEESMTRLITEVKPLLERG